MNTANPVQRDFVNDANYGIDAMLWCGDLGSTGANAIADILVGNLNPSGKLSDTFWTKHYYNPVYANWGAYNYTGSVSSGNSNIYVAYQEGIYNGYLYTETRYEDYVLEQGNAGEFLYDEIVSYPFGYGVSYTQFSYSDFKVTAPSRGSEDYTVSVTVKNIGSVAGKETAEIYLQKPYTDYDIQNGIEKASVELVGFAKTKLLDGGDSETFRSTLSFERQNVVDRLVCAVARRKVIISFVDDIRHLAVGVVGGKQPLGNADRQCRSQPL